MSFEPIYTISSQIARDLMRIEAARLNLSPRGARAIAQKWVHDGFLVIANPSKRGRTYQLAHR